MRGARWRGARAWAWWVLGLAVVGCGDDGGPPPLDAGPADGGPTCTTLIWDPAVQSLDRWPEPELVTDDPSTTTGYRLRLDPARYAELIGRTTGFSPVLTEDLSDLDGFGVNADAYFRFVRALDPALLPTGEQTLSPGAGLGFVVLEPGPARLWPALVRTVDRGTTPMLAPMGPLPARGRVAVFVTRALAPAAGGCIEPSPAMAAYVSGPEAAPAVAALQSLGVISDASDLVALSVFPTMSIVEDSVAVAAHVAGLDVPLDGPAACATEDLWIRCEAAFTAEDYRDPDGVLRIDRGAVAPVTTYRVPVTVWLPLSGAAPFPTLLFGHGLGSGQEQGAELARFAAPRGIATVGIPALEHGAHPTSADPTRPLLETVIAFFAVGEDLSVRAFHGLRHRDNWRQSTYDKLQITRWLQSSPDVDGDGVADLDGARLAYLGASLGGIMGAELLALTDAYRAGVLAVPGGRVISIIAESETFRPLVTLLRPSGVSEGDVDRFFPVLQTVVDRGDAASYAPHVLRDRLIGDGSLPPPSVILGVALDDDTVPNVSNYALARALDVPIAPQLLRPVPGLSAHPTTPISGNVAAGAATAGLLQFDVVRHASGELRDATHSNTPSSDVGARAWFEFLTTHWNDGLAVVVDPYALESVPHRDAP